jgi:hypothetical protein
MESYEKSNNLDEPKMFAVGWRILGEVINITFVIPLMESFRYSSAFVSSIFKIVILELSLPFLYFEKKVFC